MSTRLLVTGICGFVGSAITRALLESVDGLHVIGVDNFVRAGSEINRRALADQGVRVVHADLRCSSDLDALPRADWVIDAAANPRVLAGIDGRTSPRQLLEHNLGGTLNVLEFCRRHQAGLILLSTSRVYSLPPLAALPVDVQDDAFRPRGDAMTPHGVTAAGIAEAFSTEPPVSLYGASKAASETIALEYAHAFGIPVWIARCGVLAGSGQFGTQDQGIFSYWINAHLRRRPLTYIGFGGYGYQVRDCLHPRDLAALIACQMRRPEQSGARVVNLGGGPGRSMSLAQLTAWCDARFGRHQVDADPTPRPFDVPWIVMDSGLARRQWDWHPTTSLEDILVEIARHAEQHPEWLAISES